MTASVLHVIAHGTAAQWSAVAAIAAAVAALSACVVAIRQTKLSKLSWQAQNAVEISRDLQSDKQRSARGCIFALAGDEVPYHRWTEEEKHQADLMIQQLQLAVILNANELLVRDLLRDSWGATFVKACRAGHERIEDQRSKSGNDSLWRAFEDFAKGPCKGIEPPPFYQSDRLDPRSPFFRKRAKEQRRGLAIVVSPTGIRRRKKPEQ
jgi:hypothetical protein